MSRDGYKPRCCCGVQKVDGRCPEGCDAFRKPAQRAIEEQSRERRRLRQAAMAADPLGRLAG